MPRKGGTSVFICPDHSTSGIFSVAAAPASAAAGALAAAAAAAVGQTRKHDQGDDYPDETFIVPEEIAKAVHNTTSL